MNKDKIIYFSDELNDEFSTAQIQPRKIDESYNYDGNKFLRAISHFFWYRIIFYPGAWIYLKLVYHHKIINRKALKKEKKNSFFLYGNHTNDMADPYIPTFVALKYSFIASIKSSILQSVLFCIILAFIALLVFSSVMLLFIPDIYENCE